MATLFAVNDSDEMWVVKNFFSEFDDNLCPSCISYILGRTGYGNEYALCSFPEGIEPDEEPFTGVRFSAYGDHIKVIDEGTFRSITLEACRRYIVKNPSTTEEIKGILAKHGMDVDLTKGNPT